MKSCGGFLLIFSLSGFFTLMHLQAHAASPREPEEIWQELLKLPADERQKRLVAGARAEGKAIVYGNISADHLERLRIDFDKRYGVKLDGYRAAGERVANRLLTEARSGKLDADVMAPSNEHIPTLIKAGVAGRYNSPERAAFPDSHKDRLGYWTAYDYNVAVIAYNSRLVPALANPFLQVFSGKDVIAQNNDWQDGPSCNGFVCGTAAQIAATGLDPCQPNPGQPTSPPNCTLESAILITLPTGAYTAIVSGGGGGTGVGLVEAFEMD